MDDSAFVAWLYKANESPSLVDMHLTHEDWMSMTSEQKDIMQAVLCVAHIGGKDKVSGGLSRIKPKFPGNFDKSGNAIGSGGKQKQGALSMIQNVVKNMKMAKIHKQVESKELSQKKACAAAKVDPSDYRTWRDSRRK